MIIDFEVSSLSIAYQNWTYRNCGASVAASSELLPRPQGPAEPEQGTENMRRKVCSMPTTITEASPMTELRIIRRDSIITKMMPMVCEISAYTTRIFESIDGLLLQRWNPNACCLFIWTILYYFVQVNSILCSGAKIWPSSTFCRRNFVITIKWRKVSMRTCTAVLMLSVLFEMCRIKI